MIERYGSEENFRQHMQELATKGGKSVKSENRYFSRDREAARNASLKSRGR